MARAKSPKPVIIAHRGASGYLPEHTLASKALAYGMGADYLEQDVVASADGTPVVFHDLMLDHTTDVTTRFPGRARDDGLSYVADFTTAELRELRVTERRRANSTLPRWPNRFPVGVGHFHIVTLAEELQFIAALNRATGRTTGAYVEIKKPAWHREQGIDLSRLVLACLDENGLADAPEQVFLQCFDYGEVCRLRRELGTRLPLIQLLRDRVDGTGESDFPALCTPEGLRGVAQVADGIGPFYGQLLEQPAKGSWLPSSLFKAAREVGLLVHPYTFRADCLPEWATSFEELLAFFIHRLQVDGLFCDFPDRALRVRDEQPLNP